MCLVGVTAPLLPCAFCGAHFMLQLSAQAVGEAESPSANPSLFGTCDGSFSFPKGLCAMGQRFVEKQSLQM